jgi:hypothetical protein
VRWLSRLPTGHHTIGQEALDAVAERDVDRASADRALEHLRDLGAAANRLVAASDRLHARPLEVFHREVDTQGDKPLQRGARLFTQPSYDRRIDAPLVHLRVVVEHGLW